jgi:hypothetical protein
MPSFNGSLATIIKLKDKITYLHGYLISYFKFYKTIIDTLTKVAYFSMICGHISFWDPTQSGDNVSATLHVEASSVLLLLSMGN